MVDLSSNAMLAEFLRRKADGAGHEDAALFGLCARAVEESSHEPRACTCHPDDNPPRPCPQKYALTECRRAAQPPAALRDLLTEFGQAYMKLCAEGSEHHARVEAAERAIQAHYSGQPPVPEQLKAAEELAMRAYWHPFQAAAIERLAGEYLDKYVRTRPTKRHEYVPMTICEKCGDHLPVGWLHACSGSGE